MSGRTKNMAETVLALILILGRDESILQDKSTHVVFTFPNSTT
jgi:hypothetical protein